MAFNFFKKFINEENNMDSNTLSLQEQMSSLQSSQALELADLYKLLSFTNNNDTLGFNTFVLNKEERKELEALAAKYNLDIENTTRKNIHSKIQEKKSHYNSQINRINKEICINNSEEDSTAIEIEELNNKMAILRNQLSKIDEKENSKEEKVTLKFCGLA